MKVVISHYLVSLRTISVQLSSVSTSSCLISITHFNMRPFLALSFATSIRMVLSTRTPILPHESNVIGDCAERHHLSEDQTCDYVHDYYGTE